MINIINCIDKYGKPYQLKVFKDKRFGNIEILLPMRYTIYAKRKNDIIWVSNDDLSFELIESIVTDEIIIINRNTMPINMSSVEFVYNNKKHDLDALMHIVKSCQHISIGIYDDKTMINVEYCYVTDIKRSKDNQYIIDFVDIIDDSSYHGYNLGYEEEVL